MSRPNLTLDSDAPAIAGRMEWLRCRLRQFAGEPAAPDAEPRRHPTSDAKGRNPGTSTDIRGLAILSDVFGLSQFECDVLFLCVAMEFDPRLPAMCSRASCGAHAHPTFALALELFDGPSWEALSPHRSLRRLRLVEVHHPAGVPLIAAALRADERIVNFVKGLNELDDRLAPLLTPWDLNAGDVALPPSQAAIVEEVCHAIITRLQSARTNGAAPVVQLIGSDHRGKQCIAMHVCHRLGVQPLRMFAAQIPRDFHEQETLVRLWERESHLLPVCLYVSAVDAGPEVVSTMQHVLSRLPGLVFLESLQAVDVPGRSVNVHEVQHPTPAEQRALWQQVLPDIDGLAARLAGQFRLDAAAIAELAALHGDTRNVAGTATRLWKACREQARPQLDQLAQRVHVKARWDDFVLPEEERKTVQDIIAHVAQRSRVLDDWGFDERLNRGTGLTVLFAGESGTGKTMAAEVIAGELDLDLYRIDLSAVVNKYIGETEKNLRKVFDAAEAGGVILLFDEADALFGKRTEVKDSHDRYANIEVNYLLQRMESFRGLAILATNLKTTLDTAFLRRLRYVVDFPIPDRQQRREIWSRAFPAAAPLSGLDYQRLAQLPLTGGNVHSIVMNAAFAAAGNGGVIDMPHLLRSARAECKKLKKPLSAADFHWSAHEGRSA